MSPENIHTQTGWNKQCFIIVHLQTHKYACTYTPNKHSIQNTYTDTLGIHTYIPHWGAGTPVLETTHLQLHSSDVHRCCEWYCTYESAVLTCYTCQWGTLRWHNASTATDCTSGASTCTSAGCSLNWKASHQQSTMIKTALPAKGTMTYIRQWSWMLEYKSCCNDLCNEWGRKGQTAQNIAQRVSYMRYGPATWVQV